MSDDLLYFNGVNGATGGYGLKPMTGDELARRITGQEPAENARELAHRHESKDLEHFGLQAGLDAGDLAEAGWGVVFPHDAEPSVREALEPLIALRREQAGDRFYLYEGSHGYRPNDTKDKFLRRCGGGGSGPVDPDRVPYYLLIVGAPTSVPFRFQNLLGVPHAVGRITFDAVEDYARYAESVVAAERGEANRSRGAAFFGVKNANDQATRLSSKHLVEPLLKELTAKHDDWDFSSYLGEDADKANLLRLLGGDATPALLFSASHGMEFPSGDTRQRPHQGALLCGDWPGPREWKEAIPQDFYVAGDDLASDASMLGLIHINFACYGGGTPQLDEYAKQKFQEHRATIAPEPFVARLPMSMLSHPRGGALAAIAHVDRAWSYSFMAPGVGSQTSVFKSAFYELLNGLPIGAAMEHFTDRYAEIATVLAAQLEDLEFGAAVAPEDLIDSWTSHNDARGYLILGDPAVRAAVAKQGEESVERPTIEVRTRKPEVSAEISEEEKGPESFGVTTEASSDASSVVVVTSVEGATVVTTRLSTTGESRVDVVAPEKLDENIRRLHENAVEQAVRMR